LSTAAAELSRLLKLLIYRDNDNINLNSKVIIAFVIYKEKADKKLIYKLREEEVIIILEELFKEL